MASSRVEQKLRMPIYISGVINVGFRVLMVMSSQDCFHEGKAFFLKLRANEPSLLPSLLVHHIYQKGAMYRLASGSLIL